MHTERSKDRDMGYTTVLKLMQIMVEKGLVARDERARFYCFRLLQSEAATQHCLMWAVGSSDAERAGRDGAPSPG